MCDFKLKKIVVSVAASTVLLGALTSASAAPILPLTDGGSIDADLVENLSTLDAGHTFTLTNSDGQSGELSGSVGGFSDGVGTIIIDGNVQAIDFNVGELGNSLSKVIVNSGVTLDLDGGSINATSTVIGGTVNLSSDSSRISGTIDGISAGVGTLDYNFGNVTSGVIGGTNALANISINDGELRVFHNISATDIVLSSGTLATEAEVTITGNISGGSSSQIFLLANTTLKGSIGSSNQPVNFMQIAPLTSLTLSGDVFKNSINVGLLVLDHNSEIIIDASSSALASGESVTLISTEGIVLLDNAAITGPLDTLFTDYTTTVTANTVVVSAAYTDAATLGLTGELAELYVAAADAIGSTDELFAALNSATTTQEIKDILESLQPDTTAGAAVGGMGLVNSAVNTISSHLKLARANGTGVTGIATGDESLSKTVWAQVYGNTAEQDDRGGVAGYDVDGYGMVIGFDSYINDSTILGVALAKGTSDVESKGIGRAQTDIDSIQLSLYLSKEFAEGYFVEGVVSYANNDNDTSRTVAGVLTASADYDSDLYSARLTTGKAMKFNGLNVTPEASLNYIHFETDGYTETGAGGANLTVDTKEFKKWDASLGVSISKAIDMANSAVLVPELKVGITQEMGDDMSTMSSTFAGGGSAFNTNGMDAADTALDAGFGLSYTTPDKTTEIRLDYDMKAKSDYMSHSGMLTARWSF